MEISEFIDSFQKDWAEFKKTNDAAIKGLPGKAEIEEKLAKINASLDKHQDVTNKLVAMEAAIKRFGSFDHKGADGNMLTPDQVEHKVAFSKWMRRGDEGLKGVDLKALEVKALSVNDDTQGGFMVHADLSGRIVRKIFETSPLRMYASVANISTDALEGPYDQNQADYGWVAEAGARAVTNTPKIGMWRIPTHEIFAQPAATQKLLDDAAWDADTWLADKVSDRFSRAENYAFVNGNGVTMPKGFLTENTVADATGAAGASGSGDFTETQRIGYIATGTADNFPPVPATGADPAQADPIINLIFALKTQYREAPGTAFAMHRTIFGRVRRLRDNLGNYLWQPGLGGVPSTLMGYPIAEFNDMPLLGDTNKFALAFANWRQAYQIVDRIGIRVLRDPYTQKPFVLFYSTKRTGGKLLNFEAIKLLKFATT